MDPKELAEARLERTSKIIGQLDAPQALAVELGTAAAIVSILSSIINIYKFFDGLGEKPVGEWIEEIDAKLSHLEELMTEVSRDLAELKVALPRQFEHQAERAVLSRIRVFGDLIPELRRPESAGFRKEWARRQIEELLVARNELMLLSYSSFSHVALAMPLETDLMRLAGFAPETFKRVYSSYVNYFKSCQDPTIPQSLAGALQGVEFSLQLIRQHNPDRNNETTPFPLVFISRRIGRRVGGREGDFEPGTVTYCTAVAIISGSVTAESFPAFTGHVAFGPKA